MTQSILPPRSQPPASALRVKPSTLPIELERWSSTLSVDEMAGRVAHDLIQPLTDIVNQVWLCRELIRSASDPAGVHEALADIEDQAMQTAEMIRTVRRLVASRITDRHPIEPSGATDTVC